MLSCRCCLGPFAKPVHRAAPSRPATPPRLPRRLSASCWSWVCRSRRRRWWWSSPPRRLEAGRAIGWSASTQAPPARKYWGLGPLRRPARAQGPGDKKNCLCQGSRIADLCRTTRPALPKTWFWYCPPLFCGAAEFSVGGGRARRSSCSTRVMAWTGDWWLKPQQDDTRGCALPDRCAGPGRLLLRLPGPARCCCSGSVPQLLPAGGLCLARGTAEEGVTADARALGALPTLPWRSHLAWRAGVASRIRK